MADRDLTVHLKADDKITPAAKKAADALSDLERKGDVEVDIKAKGLDDLTDKLGSLPGTIGDVAGGLGSLGAAVGGVGALATGLFAAANYAKDLALSAKTTADLTGSTVEEASKLQNLWGRTGADVNDLNDVLLQMNGALAQSPELASQLGINLNDGKNITQRFVELTDQLAAGQLSAQQASQLFGEEGVRQVGKLRTVYGGLSDDIEGMPAPIDDDDVEQALEMERALGELTNTVKSIAAAAAQELIPVFTELAETANLIGDNLPGGDEGEGVTGLLSRFNDLAKQVIPGANLPKDLKKLNDLFGEGNDEAAAGVDIWGSFNRMFDRTADVIGDAADANTDYTAAGRAANDALVAQVNATLAAQRAMKTYGDTVAAAAFGQAGIEGGLAGMSAFTDQLFALGNIAQASEVAIGELTAGVAEGGLTFDVATEAGRKNQDALEGVARTIDTQLAAAYDAADGDMATFKKSAEVISLTTLARLQDEMNLSAEDTQALGEKLGLLPADIETRYNLSGDEEAKLKLGLLQASIDDLPDSVETKVNQQIIMGDYQGALSTINSYYARNPATLPVKVVLGSSYPKGYNPVTGTIDIRAAPDAATMAATTATAVPTGPAVSMAPTTVKVPAPSITINAAVVGNRFDVERTITRALRNYERVNGRRP